MKNNGIKIGSWNGIQLKENNMKLLEVYSYRDQAIYKFIHKSICYKYFGYYRNLVSKAQIYEINTAYKRVVRKTYEFT